MSLILQTPWTRQPQVAVGVNWAHSLARDLEIVTTRNIAYTKAATLMPAASNISVGAGPAGVGYSSDGNSARYARFDTGFILPATSEVTLEFLVWGSSYPSLTALGALTAVANTDGTANTGAANGSLRGGLSYLGAGPPYNLYWWGGGNDANSGVAWENNKLQHVVMTKPAGTGVCAITFYRNGVQVAQVNTSGSNAYIDTGPYYYVLGRHSAATATVTGTVFKSALYKRVLSVAEITQLYVNPWQIFQPQQRRIWVPAAAAGGAFNAAWAHRRSRSIGAGVI